MKVVLLAGGFGTRLAEETEIKPKPMVEIGGYPVLWHIMKIYAHHGLTDFIVCCGYKGYVIKEYFANYLLHRSDVTFDLKNNKMELHLQRSEPWRVTLADTGENVMTGGRVKRVRQYIGDETFCLTYGDGVGDVDIKGLIAFHKQQNVLATLTATKPPGRYGAVTLAPNSDKITTFREKPAGDGALINGGFFVLEPKAIDYIDNDQTSWESEPLERLANEGKLAAFRHNGFWQPMDTLRDRNHLNDLWKSGKAPWKCW